MEFFQSNWQALLFGLVLVAYLITNVILKRWDHLRALGYKAMLSAEKAFKDAKGSQKFDEVVKLLYAKLPVYFKIFMSEEAALNMLRVNLQEWYDSAKDLADDGKKNNSTKSGGQDVNFKT